MCLVEVISNHIANLRFIWSLLVVWISRRSRVNTGWPLALGMIQLILERVVAHQVEVNHVGSWCGPIASILPVQCVGQLHRQSFLVLLGFLLGHTEENRCCISGNTLVS